MAETQKALQTKIENWVNDPQVGAGIQYMKFNVTIPLGCCAVLRTRQYAMVRIKRQYTATPIHGELFKHEGGGLRCVAHRR